MTVSEIQGIKEQIAIQHLNLAIRQYLLQENYYSVIHLAGAAEEILGKLVLKSGKLSSFVHMKKFFESWIKITKSNQSIKTYIKYSLKVRNEMKHFDSDDITWIHHDFRIEAKEIIDRSIENINLLGIQNTHEILEYLSYSKGN